MPEEGRLLSSTLLLPISAQFLLVFEVFSIPWRSVLLVATLFVCPSQAEVHQQLRFSFLLHYRCGVKRSEKVTYFRLSLSFGAPVVVQVVFCCSLSDTVWCLYPSFLCSDIRLPLARSRRMKSLILVAFLMCWKPHRQMLSWLSTGMSSHLYQSTPTEYVDSHRYCILLFPWVPDCTSGKLLYSGWLHLWWMTFCSFLPHYKIIIL